MSEYKFTQKQRDFIDQYVIHGNASEAARQAGYSEKTAFRSGQQNMQNTAIVAEIDRRKAIVSKKANVDAVRARKEIMELLAHAKAEQDMHTWAKAVDMLGKATGAYSQTVNVNDQEAKIQKLIAGRKRVASLTGGQAH